MNELIEEARLTIDMTRTRNGSTQMFRRDYGDNKFTDKNNADVILKHERPEMYAELIDEKWYWVNDCSKCNGVENKYSYVVCEKHDVCSECSTPRKQIKGSVYGVKNGWCCVPCMEILESITRKQAFDKLDGKEPRTICMDEVVCPHCGSGQGCDDIYENHEMECDVCKGVMTVDVSYRINYSTAVVGKRMTS